MSIYDYFTTAASNTSIDGTNVAEGCAPAGINDAIRSLMADVAQLADDVGGALDTTGSSNAYAVTTAQTITAYADGLFLRVRANHTSSGAATLNVDSLGAKNLKKFTVYGVADIVAGDLQAGGVYDVSFDSGNDRFVVLGLSGAQKIGAPDTTGSSNTYAVTTAQPFTAYSDGLALRFRANHTSSGPATLNVDSLGAKSLKKFTIDGVADMATGDLQAGGVYDVSFDSGNDRFVVLGLAGGHKIGTWTPLVSASSGLTGTFISYTGTYSKIGNLVFLNLVITGTSMGFTNSSSFLTLDGLPYAPVTYSAGAFGSTTANTVNGVAVVNSATNVLILSNDAVNGTTNLLIASVTYRAAI